jgi:5-methylcytosine-specific restriction endonuclease McrA
MVLNASISQLSDDDLLAETARAVADERRGTASLLELLGEVDERRLYLGQSCSSLFTYCTQVLHLSEDAAYYRMEAARAARQFPVILEMIREGALTLAAVKLLRPHLTLDNHRVLLEAARHRSKSEVQYQVACLTPRPDERPLVRKLPAPVPSAVRTSHPSAPSVPLLADVSATRNEIAAPARRSIVAPLAPDRYLLKVTLTAATHARLRRAQALMRHTIPNGDPASVIDHALAHLVQHLERTKFASTTRPRPRRAAGQARSRRVPAGIRREVWKRDDGRCAFVGANGRCHEASFLEFHHVRPFADGGTTTTDNLQLRCRAHNRHEVDVYFGPRMGADG